MGFRSADEVYNHSNLGSLTDIPTGKSIPRRFGSSCQLIDRKVSNGGDGPAFLQERVAFGLLPHTQALLLARFMRGDLDGYPSFLWK